MGSPRIRIILVENKLDLSDGRDCDWKVNLSNLILSSILTFFLSLLLLPLQGFVVLKAEIQDRTFIYLKSLSLYYRVVVLPLGIVTVCWCLFSAAVRSFF